MSHRPTATQREILTRAHAYLSTEHTVSEITAQTHYSHWEDEELGFPPLGSSLCFRLEARPFQFTVGTPWPWETKPNLRIVARFSDHDSDRDRPTWAMLLCGPLRRSLEALGWCDRMGYHEASWAADRAAPGAIERTLVQTLALEIPLLTPERLPPDRAWPWRGLIRALASDRIVRVERSSAGKWLVVVSLLRKHERLQLDDADLDLLRSWHAEGKS